MTLRVLADSVLADGSVSGAVLAYIPSPSQGVWHLGPFPLRAYALCIIVGIIIAIWWGERRWRERGGNPGAILDVAMFAVPFGLVGGRLYHVATDWQKYFGATGHPIDALKIYQGGLGIWGAVLLGGVGAWIGCRMYRIPLPALGDAVAPPILLAQAIGRLGNYFNQELYGRETDLPWGLQIFRRVDADGRLDLMNGVSTGVVDKIVHPTFLYELVWNLLVVAALVFVDKRFQIGHGRLFALYVAGYCFGRFFVELMRDDEATKIVGIRINSFTSALVFLAAIAYFVFATKGRETAEQLQPSVGPRPWPWQIGALRVAGAEVPSEQPPSGAGGADEDVDAAAGEDESESEAGTATAESGEQTDGASTASKPAEAGAVRSGDVTDSGKSVESVAGKAESGAAESGKSEFDKAESDRDKSGNAESGNANTGNG
ncbi:prolipoprotein diacylglyceryl transferase [Nocardia sp. NPDC049220]|uniref:prolipoprotein diacylglyceryl transferase n=1 Tax=Nocardia sp. NPDC049220 TaxID=3155273 RepID=UPI003400E10F